VRSGRYLSRRIVFTGETSSHNSNSNWGRIQGTEIVTPSSQVSGIIPSARSYSAGVLDQTLELQIEQSRSPHSTQFNPRDSHWTHEDEQPNTTKTGMEDSHLTIAEDKLKSHQNFGISKQTNPERQYSQKENGYDHTKQNVSKVNIYSGQFDSNQSGVIDYIPEDKVYENATLNTIHISNTQTIETHQLEIPGEHHQNEQLTLHRQQEGRDDTVLEDSVENTTRERTILTQNQSSYSNENAEYEISSTVGYSADNSGENHSGPYNTSSLPHGQDTEQMATSTSHSKGDASPLVLNQFPVHANITRQENKGSYVRRFPLGMYTSNLSNSHHVYSTLPSESHTGQDQISQFRPSESVFSTPLSTKSHVPMPYSQPNSGEHESRMHTSLGFRWKNQWTWKGWLLQDAKGYLVLGCRDVCGLGLG
jgi:hypothetical protein